MKNHAQHSMFDRVFITTALVVFGLVGAITGSTLSDAHGVTDRQVNCHTLGARWLISHDHAREVCRDRGWVIRPRLVVTPRAVVAFSRLPHCTQEDGTTTLPCSWNFGPSDGNGRGLEFYWNKDHTIHYVWFGRPNVNGWSWVSSSLADALAEGGSPHADTRRWERCVVNYGPTTVVRCPDGHREVS